jgi:HNH endonuclease
MDRFWAYTEKSEGCWRWTGPLHNAGYGMMFTVDRGSVLAHRFAYEALVGPIPEGMQIDHLCHNRDRSCTVAADCPHRRCVRPDHLQPATHRDNTLRGNSPHAQHGRATRCPQGHPYDETNTYVNRGRRSCRTCKRKRNRERVVRIRNERRERVQLQLAELLVHARSSVADPPER